MNCWFHRSLTVYIQAARTKRTLTALKPIVPNHTFPMEIGPFLAHGRQFFRKKANKASRHWRGNESEATKARHGNCDTCNQPVETWDDTEASIKASAAVYRTGERFGVAHLIDVLVGKVTDRTSKFSHTEMPVFAGNHLSATTRQSVFRLAHSLIPVAHDEFGAIKLDESARAVFKKEINVVLRKHHREKFSKGTKGPTPLGTRVPGLSGRDEQLFQAMRAERMAIAKELGVAPYVIFPDAT